MLDDDGDFEVVGEAGDGREAVALARRLLPDLVLLDLFWQNRTTHTAGVPV